MGTSETLRAAKRAARAAAIERRRAAKAAAGEAAAVAALAHLCAGVKLPGEGAVSGYWPMEDEFDVRPMLEHFSDAGRVCALPVVTRLGEPLLFRRWRKGDALVANRLGIHEPAGNAPIIEPAILLVPLLAFDGDGYRLGYGGGFYDRTLARLRARGPMLAIGVAFAGQAAEAVPHGPLDERLDWIVTEQGAAAFSPIAAETAAR
ncbi:MAG: 5-formyltetrahydrofolate cyclo-ligase [Alphaproteobacteria bacterium]